MTMQRRVDGMICREHVELELYLLEAHRLRGELAGGA